MQNRVENPYTNKQIRHEINNEKKEAKIIVLQPIGYPLESSFIETPDIEVKNNELFDIYAKEQWINYKLHKDQYLFDQKLMPDFAFQVIDVRPNNSYVTNNTSFLMIPSQKEDTSIAVNTEYTFDDVIGQEKAKNKTQIIRKYLENPSQFKDWAPKNILFYGMPGTGKTMLAQALANELNIPIKMIKSTTLIGDYVGDGAKQIHKLYEKTRKKRPAVIFIDEIDAIALERKYQSLRGDVIEIVNALLTEMDGIENNEGIITICATNNPSLLDYAIRSRFEEEIEFELPDEDARREIIEKNVLTLPIKCDFDVEDLVKKTNNLSGRDIKEKILKTALHKAISESEDEITSKHVEYAIKETKKHTLKQDTMFV